MTEPKRCSTAASIKSTNVLAVDAAGGGEETHGFAITAIEREGDPHPFTFVAANLKDVGAPAAVALIDGDASLMSPLDPARMAIEQEAVHLHHPVSKPACDWAPPHAWVRPDTHITCKPTHPSLSAR